MAKSIHFISRFEAQDMEPDPSAIMISLHGTDEKPARLKLGWNSVLQLQFDDINHATSLGVLKVFTPEQAKEIVDFVIAHHAEVEKIYVHCHAGISRSAAVAMVVGDYLDIPIFSKDTPLNPSYSLYNKKVYDLLALEFLRHDGAEV